MRTTMCASVVLGLLAVAGVTQAQDDHSNHDMSTMPMPSDDAGKAYMDGMKRMSQQMNAAMTGDADVDFAVMMIPHHQGAIDMAKVQLRYGKDPALRKLSEAIVSAQQGEIDFLKGWLAKHPAPETSTSAHAQHSRSGMAYMEGMEKMDADMGVAMSGDPDKDFAVMMIPHHQGAIDMAKVQLANGRDPELRKLSEAIINAQEGEIAFLKEWLSKR